MKKQAIVFWVVVSLAVFAILDGLFGKHRFSWNGLILPLVVVGIVFLLYKFPPGNYRKKQPKIKPSARTMAKIASERRTAAGEKRKSYPFRVIEGNKGKNDDHPKYH